MKWLRGVLLALLLSLLAGFAIGTLLRLRLERPVEYIGEQGGHGRVWVVAGAWIPIGALVATTLSPAVTAAPRG